MRTSPSGLGSKAVTTRSSRGRGKRSIRCGRAAPWLPRTGASPPAVLPLPDGGTLLTYVDVSDSKRVERALIERAEALEAADRLKTAFISHVSYELRTPLTNIIVFSALPASPIAGPLTEKQPD